MISILLGYATIVLLISIWNSFTNDKFLLSFMRERTLFLLKKMLSFASLVFNINRYCTYHSYTVVANAKHIGRGTACFELKKSAQTDQ